LPRLGLDAAAVPVTVYPELPAAPASCPPPEPALGGIVPAEGPSPWSGSEACFDPPQPDASTRPSTATAKRNADRVSILCWSTRVMMSLPWSWRQA